MLFYALGTAQEEIYISRSYCGFSLTEFINRIEQDLDLRFYYIPADTPDTIISCKADSSHLLTLLSDHLVPSGVFVSADRNGNIFLTKATKIRTELPGDFFKHKQPKSFDDPIIDAPLKEFLQTTDQYVVQTIIIGDKNKGVNRSSYTLSGYARNASTGEMILGATILEHATGRGTVTDVNGFYSLTLKKGEHILTVRSVNLKEKQIKVEMLSDGELDLILEDKVVMLPDVLINAGINNKVKGTEMGMEKIKVKSVNKIPLV